MERADSLAGEPMDGRGTPRRSLRALRVARVYAQVSGGQNEEEEEKEEEEEGGGVCEMRCVSACVRNEWKVPLWCT